MGYCNTHHQTFPFGKGLPPGYGQELGFIPGSTISERGYFASIFEFFFCYTVHSQIEFFLKVCCLTDLIFILYLKFSNIALCCVSLGTGVGVLVVAILYLSIPVFYIVV